MLANVELRYKVNAPTSAEGYNNTPTLQYRCKKISIIDRTEKWSDWVNVPTKIVDDDGKEM